ncbi:hypothetical protein [Sphingomonas sp. VNH70]|uniref:hypothetical protein n=1 Tax=Sphingomonas silueang TaxID=3156617 RepID=UPI0032B5E08F
MSYFVRRAEQQLELAQRAEHEQVVHAHYELANLYLDIAYADEAPPVSAVVPEAA